MYPCKACGNNTGASNGEICVVCQIKTSPSERNNQCLQNIYICSCIFTLIFDICDYIILSREDF
jgi:hypothetical protein